MSMTYEQFIAAFPPAAKPSQSAVGANWLPALPTGDWNTERLNLIRSGKEWHRPVLELVGSLVQKGLSDEIILALAPSLTREGYTVDQTIAELRPMIGGARAKGFAAASPSAAPTGELFDHVLDISLEPPSWLIDGILPEASVAAIVAPSYSGKSYIAIDMACSIASGKPYHGRRVASGEVFCVIGESRSGWRRRVASWCKDRGVDVSRQGLALHCSKYGLNFRDPAVIDAIKAELRACESVKLIIIDTLARSFGGGNENAAQDMGQFIDACDALKFEFGAAVLIVHHMGKDSGAGARGSSAFYGALDTSMLVKRVGADIQLICDKQKEAPEFEPLQFCFVTLREEEDPPVLQLVATSTRTFGPRLGKNEQLALETFVEATNDMSPDRRIHRDAWREFFDRRHTGDTAKQKNDAFSRARRELVSKGLLCNLNDVYTLGDKATSDDIAAIVAGQTS